MIKQLMHGLVTGLAALTLSGCAVHFKPEDVPKDFSVYPEYRVGMDVFYTKANVSRQLRTTPVHLNDPFLSGSTTTGNPRGPDVALKVGAVASAGVPKFRVYAGGDLRYSCSLMYSGIDARKQQDSDTRPAAQGSFVDTQLIPSYTVLPLVGLEAALGDFTFRVEAGLPYAGFKVRSGHERYGKFEQVQQDTWAGWGEHVKGDVLYKISDDWRAGVSLGYEHFGAEFGGEKSDIKSILGFLQFEYKF